MYQLDELQKQHLRAYTNRPIIRVGLLYYNQSGVTELLIMTDPHYQWLWSDVF